MKDLRKVGETVFAGIDFESAGAPRGGVDWPVQVGMGTWSLKEGFGNLFVSYLHGEGTVDWYAKRVHGIDEEMLVGAPSLLSLWPEVNGRLGGGAVPVAHAKGTEKRFLRVFPGNEFDPWVDTLLLARAAMPEQKRHSLGILCEELGLGDKVRELVPGKDWHDALFDAMGSLVLLEWMVKRFGLEDLPLWALVVPNTGAWYRLRKAMS
ncbi:MAG: 3'-5' exonuclease [Armatimonadetes bacterium]|nr:3'-5' exonuclease [Akkermansiaceae bacterium]